jgi:hypothetical protein
MSAFKTANTTALAPMASASVKTAAMANPGDLRITRRANRKSYSWVVMDGLRRHWSIGKWKQFQSQIGMEAT